MTIYLDVLLLSNLWADYALLRTTAAVTHAPMSALRGLAAAAAGAASALCVLLPPLPLPLCLAGRLLLALLICGIAFGRRRLLRQTAVFLGVSALFCGAVCLLASLRTPVGWYTQNTFIYADISLLTLLLGTAAAAAVTTWRARRSAAVQHRTYRLHLRLGTQDFILPALADTGNTLCDGFSGKPVVICGTDALAVWLKAYPDAETAAAAQKGFRLIPVRTVAGTKLLPAFLPDYAAVMRTERKSEQPLDILLALTSEPDTPAVIPAQCV
ncbi:MAG: sigma-E processing peptidase SpoIIGA [Oscillospiraceae bacterium]|nr:sigma-E processing peptidase SpoIIGA [Oscillospiraceae bacterium]